MGCGWLDVDLPRITSISVLPELLELFHCPRQTDDALKKTAVIIDKAAVCHKKRLFILSIAFRVIIITFKVASCEFGEPGRVSPR